MPGAVSIASRFRHVAAVLREHGGEDGDWFAGLVERWLDRGGDAASFDVIAGFAPNWRTELRLEGRDALVRATAREFFDGMPQRQQALGIAAKLRLYQGGRWRSDREQMQSPVEYAGRLNERLFEILKLNGGDVPSERSMQRILAAPDVCHEHPLAMAQRKSEPRSDTQTGCSRDRHAIAEANRPYSDARRPRGLVDC